MHIPITSGAVISKKIEKQNQEVEANSCLFTCHLCHNSILEKKLCCLNICCDLICHIKCLAKFYLQPGEYVPVDGKCPKCDQYFLWGDIVRKFKGCYYSDHDITINLDVQTSVD